MAPVLEKQSLKESSQLEAEAEALREGATTSQLGVYTIWSPGKVQKQKKDTSPYRFVSFDSQISYFHRIRGSFPYVVRLLKEMYSLSPVIVGLLFFVDIVQSITPGANMYVTSRLLGTIESGLIAGQINVQQARLNLAAYVIMTLGSTILDWMSSKLYLVAAHRARLHFEGLLMEASLKKDYGSFDGGQSTQDSGELNPAQLIQRLLRMLTSLLTVLSHAAALIQIAMESGVGPTFLCIWMLRFLPIFQGGTRSFFMNGCMFYVTHPAQRRMQALKDMVYSKAQRQEITGGDLGPYIMSEYQQARQDLGDTLSTRLYYMMVENPWQNIYETLLTNFPTIYYGAHAMFGSVPFQFSAVTSLQNTASKLQVRVQMLFSGGEMSAASTITRVRDFYEALDVRSELKDGDRLYPCEFSNEMGMEIILRNVSFNYPTSQSTRPAIENVSITLGAGQLIVIVGANGSGKTSLVKLLTRLHDPSSGEIMIDGFRSDEYRVQDLRRATALLSQDHALFPLSIRENIALGRPYAPDTHGDVAIAEAAQKGGADGFIRKFAQKYDTVLNPVQTKDSYGLNPQHAIMKLHAKIEKTTEVSGGERQRLVAARTFMRISDERVKLVIVDEPSAAMDPAGEYELFKHLREARPGRTMVFITHRFGHLTKHADLILCMKDGHLVESGTHAQLLHNDGEYCHLYNIQAQAFT